MSRGCFNHAMRSRSAVAFAAVAAMLAACVQPEVVAQNPQPRCDVLCGRVVDAATLKPVGRYTVAIFATDAAAPRMMVGLPPGYPLPPGALISSFEVSAADGVFEVPPVKAQKIVVGIRATNHLAFQSREIVLPGRERLDVRLERAWQVKGKVVDDDGRPVARTSIYNDTPSSELTVVLQNLRGAATPIGRSDADGRYSIDDVQNNGIPLNVIAIAPGLFPQRAQIPVAGPATAYDFRMRRGVSVSGIVVDDAGAPVRHAFVEEHTGGESLRVGTDERGRFRFEALPPGNTRFAAARELVENVYARRTELAFGATIDADPAVTRELRIALPAAGVVRGRLAGLALIDSNYRVSVRCGTWVQSAPGGPRGEFRITVPAGECDVRGQYTDESSSLETDTKHVTVSDGSETVIEPSFLNPTELKLTVNGTPLREKLSLTREGASSPALSLFGGDNSYRLAGLRSGRYEATFEMLGSAYRFPIDIGSGAELAVELTLSAPRIEVVNARGGRLSPSIDVIRASYAPGQPRPVQDRLELSGMPAGEYELRLRAPGYQERIVALRLPGDAMTVTLDAKPLPFTHTDAAPPVPQDEAAVIAAILTQQWGEARHFWMRDARQARGRLVVLSETALPRLDAGLIYGGAGPEHERREYRAVADSPAFPSLKAVAADVRSLDALRGTPGILLQPWSRLPLAAPERLERAATEVEAIDGDAFYERYPEAAGLVTVSRAAIDGDEAVVFVGRMMVQSIGEWLVRLRRVNGEWRIQSSAAVYEEPGC